MKVLFNLVLAMVLCLTVASVAMPVFAQNELQSDIYGDLDTIGSEGFDQDPDTAPTLPETVGRVIRIILTLLGVILVVIVVYAGFLWMTAGGNDDQVKKAKSWLTNAIIGLIIILAAYAITDFVITKVFEATSTQ